VLITANNTIGMIKNSSLGL